MEAVLLCGMQAAGKTSFYVARYLHTHVRISLDLLRTPNRERRMLELCLETRMPFVVDRVNATPAERERFIAPAREHGFRVVGWVLEAEPRVAIARNAERPERRQVPVPAILGTRGRLLRRPPRLEEGFDELHRVRAERGEFVVVASQARDEDGGPPSPAAA